VQSRLKQALQRRRRAALIAIVGLAARPLRRERPDDPYHAVFADFVRAANALEDYRLLELGARGTRVDPRLTGYREYVGLDVHPGPNVDVVGDAHRLSQLVEGPFDAIYSISTFEHLAMPWKVVLELNRVLRVGGLVFTATHHTWPPHELPWDYWRYSRGAFESLLNEHTGFELLRVEEGLPALIVPMTADDATRDVPRNPAPLAVSALARKIGPARSDLSWDLSADDVARGSYPTHEDGASSQGMAAEG
jgi:SAM-dependent methyltransferase